jgi:hypothetical protein
MPIAEAGRPLYLLSMKKCRLGDRRGELLVGDRRRAAELAPGNLHVLRKQGRAHVERRQRVVVQLVEVQPDAHRVLGPVHVEVADAVDAADGILDVRDHVVGDVELGHAVVGGDEAHEHQEGVGGFRHTNARLLHRLRKQRHGELQLVLHLHLRDVRIGAGREGECRGGLARVVAHGRHVDQIVDAAHLLLDHLHDHVVDGDGGGTRVGRADLHRGRRDGRVLVDG